jgi:hypothetical protein
MKKNEKKRKKTENRTRQNHAVQKKIRKIIKNQSNLYAHA